ncbi:MAG TPA: BMP family ABC transporter substrate-binding protein [Pyrinomonadaceae bacterium]|nr:BMP family ABC transporter substrate-binding protein [Pyrinomonadaceae bacterium]
MKTSLFMKLCVLLMLSALAFGGASCAGAGRAGGDREKVHVGIVFDTGGKDDRSFNAAAWDGVRRAAEDFPIVLRDVEPGDPTSVEPAIRAFAEEGYDLIIGVGFEQMPVVERVAKDYPNLNFAVIDGEIKLPNVASLLFKEHQGSYLVGMLAAKKSRTGVIGFLGGMDIGLIHRFQKGYEEGAKAVNPNVRVLTNYVGVTADAWNNPGKGKELAVSQIERGADVIFTAAGNSGLGAFDAAEQSGRFVIGVDSNQNWVKPGYVLTSMVKRVDNAVYEMVKAKVAGQFSPGIHVFGLENNGVGYAMDRHNESLIDPAWLQEVEAAKGKIISGEIQVTDAMTQKPH